MRCLKRGQQLLSLRVLAWPSGFHRSPEVFSPKPPSLFAVAVTTQTSQRKGLRDCFQVGNSTCTGVGGIGFFAAKGIELRCPPLNRSLGSLSQVGKGRLGLQTAKLCRLSKVWKCSPPTLLSLLFGDITVATGSLSSLCFILHFWDPFLLFCAGALGTFRKSEKKN